ncbi:MAG: M56 family metallopeptidase, partial [Planctomycetota bacterium]
QLLALTVFWFHPFVWLASRRVGQLCELCCDDDTVRTFGLKPIDYARGLLAVLSHRGTTRSATFALAIGTADVTRQRMEWILSENFGLGLRKSSMWIAAMLAVIVIPALGSRDLSIGLTSPVTGEGVSKKETMVEARKSERVDHSSNRRQMDFIVGHWDVVSVDGKPLGHSEFSLERSEKMIREDWQAIDGSTAQGITYYDATGGTWKMTWVDSAGTIVESSGRWNGDLLTLDGFTKSPNARKYAIQTSLKKETPDRMVSRMHVERSGRKILVSQSIYVRSDASQTLIGP